MICQPAVGMGLTTEENFYGQVLGIATPAFVPGTSRGPVYGYESTVNTSSSTPSLAAWSANGTMAFRAATQNSYAAYANNAVGNNSSQSVSVSATGQAVPQAGTVIDPSRRIDWSQAGVVGGIPARTTICGTLNPGATVAQINSALASCPAGQTVFLNAGTYVLSGSIVLNQVSNVTLRGAGANRTFLNFSSANSNCNGLGQTAICLINGDGGNYVGSPSNLASWTAGFSKGATSITINSVSRGSINNLRTGTLLVLDQLDPSSDTGNIYPCQSSADAGAANPCSQQGANGVARSGRTQSQQVTVTSVSGSGPWTIGISPGLYSPNWSSTLSPNAWWSNNLPISGVGIESLSIDTSPASSMYDNVMLHNASNSWIKGVRMISKSGSGSAHKRVHIYQSSHITVRDSYFYGSDSASESYGVDAGSISSDNLIENNIFQHIATGTITESSTGNVFGYNYAVDNFYNNGAPNWQQQDAFHHGGGDYYNLWEGHEGIGFNGDAIHGTSWMLTHFRDYFSGRDPSTSVAVKSQATFAYFPFAYSRYYNLIGCVLGTQGYHTRYQTGAASASDCGSSAMASKSVMVFGFGRQDGTAYSPECGSGSATGISNDLLVQSTLMRWGNYAACTGDAKCNAVRFDSTEVPSGIGPYANPVPSSETLPPSLYLSGRPAWWPVSIPWPPIGPDVTGGNVSGTGGHVHHNPAANCYLNIMGGKTDGSSSALSFDPTTCYASSGGGGTDTTAPSAPTGFAADSTPLFQ